MQNAFVLGQVESILHEKAAWPSTKQRARLAVGRLDYDSVRKSHSIKNLQGGGPDHKIYADLNC